MIHDTIKVVAAAQHVYTWPEAIMWIGVAAAVAFIIRSLFRAMTGD